MPSLRHTMSTPMVRASPYPTALSLSAAGALNEGGPIRPRRAVSDSETSRRRVLADIEWWRVLDGQDTDLERGQNTDTQTGVDEVEQEIAGMRLREEVSPDSEGAVSDSDGSTGASSLTVPFAALSITSVAPSTPPRRARQDGSESSNSSVESTPESSPRVFHDTLFMEGFCPDSLHIDFGFNPPPPSCIGARPSTLSAMSMMRSASFGGFASPRESTEDRFGDVIFL